MELFLVEKKDPSKYDFKPEWIKFWTNRMRELHEEAIEKKKEEIRKKLGLPKDGKEKTSELKEKYALKTTAKPRRDSLESLDDDIVSSSSSSLQKDRSKRIEKPYRRSSSRERSTKYDRNRGGRERSEHRSEHRSDHRSDHRSERARSDRRERLSRERSIHRPSSRGSYHDDSPVRYVRDEDVYYSRGHPPPYGKPYGVPKPYYSHKPHYYGQKLYGREMPASSIPRFEEIPEEEPESDEPLTVVAVLRLLSAVEELLGPSLGPKIVELLAKALALDKVKPNAADELLLNEENCVLFETVKEKLKGQLITDMVEKHHIKAVKKAIKNIAGVIHLATEREKNKTTEEKQKESTEPKTPTADESQPAAELTPDEEKREIAKKIAAALVAQGKTDISQEELENLTVYYYEKQRKAKEEAKNAQNAQNDEQQNTETPAEASESTNDVSKPEVDTSEMQKDDEEEFGLPQDASSALESLTDTDLQTLLQNFQDLSSEEQEHLHAYMKKLEKIDPKRVEKLRKYVNVAFDHQESNSNDQTDVEEPQKRASSGRSDSKRAEQNVKIDPLNDMFYDDSVDSGAKREANIIDSDDDDDDYSFDDVCKAASKNISNFENLKNIEKQQQKQQQFERKRRSPEAISDEDADRKPDQFVVAHDQFDLGDDKPSTANDETSNHSSRESSNSRNNLQDTESIIANLMGSLQKNIQNRNFVEPQSAPVDTMKTETNSQKNARPQIQSNIPFYLQQQQSQQSSLQSNPNQFNQTFNQSDQKQNNQFGFLNEFTQQFQANSQYSNQNMFNQSNQYGNSQQIPLNLPPYGQAPPQTQFTSQQAALLAQMQQQFSQQQQHRPTNQYGPNPYNHFYR